VGNRAKGERLSRLVPFEALKLAAGVVLLSRNIPLLFMGEEYGEASPFQYFISHSDPELVEAVRKGRAGAFSAFGREEGLPDPQDETTFSRSKIDLDLRHQGKHEILLRFYKRMIQIRKDRSPSFLRSKKGLQVKAFEREKGLMMKWQPGGNRVAGVFNFSDRPYRIETRIEQGTWRRIFASASEEWGGPGALSPESVVSEGSKVIFVLEPFAFALYRKEQ
jgi:maltooligosyltrehalose trehalohydrolase